jgi:serine/threonine-protein kinase
LKAAHDAGVLHRDFKSDNVMLRLDGDKLCPLIMDFGLARGLDLYAPPSSSSTRGLVGTFAYIAPEQLEGKPNTIASDVYSLGVVWFEMLTGELPFKPRSAPAVTTLDRLLRPAPAPSSRQPGLPGFVDDVVLGCLKRSPDERFATADAVLTRLNELQGRRPRPKRSLVVWMAAATALLATAAFYLVGRDARPKPSELQPQPAVTAAAAAASPALSLTKPAESAAPQAPPKREDPPLTRQASTTAATPSHPAKPRSSAPSASAKPTGPEPSSTLEVKTSATEAGTPHGWENPFTERAPAPP